MKLQDSAANFIWAVKTGSPIASNSKTVTLDQHDDATFGAFKLDLTKAAGGHSQNPFLSTNGGALPSNNTASSGGATATDAVDPNTNMKIAHAILASLAFVIFLPMGALSLRVGAGIWVHAALQLFGYLTAIAGLVTGVIIARNYDLVCLFNPIIIQLKGYVLTIVLLSCGSFILDSVSYSS